MRNRISIIATLAALATLAAGPTGAGAAVPRSITVSGTGIVTTVPNQASFTFGVTTNGHTAQAALSANSVQMNRLIAALKRLGLTSAEIQTSEISLTPNTNQTGTTIINFSASNSVTATSNSIGTVGAVVDAAVAAGANLVSGPSLTPSDQLVLSRRALAAAVADAHARATAIATAAGVKLGPVETVTEQSSTTPIVPELAAHAATASTPVEAGTVQTEEDITVTYGIA